MKCSAPRCTREASWRVHVALASPDHEVWVGLPVAVCSGHRQTIRRTVLGRGLPAILRALTRKGIHAAARVVRVQFTEIA